MFFLSPVLLSFLAVVQKPSSGVGAELGKSFRSKGEDVWEGLLTTESSSGWSWEGVCGGKKLKSTV